MSPGFGDYLKYIGYYIFAPHVPVVNMAGDPSIIENESDRKESEARINDPLLIKYFSMRCMKEAKKIMDAMVENAKKADYPLLLLYGENDMIVDKSGCDEIFTAWKGHNKKYEIIKGGSHGKSTVMKGAEIMVKWMESI
jgi:alpha-beta hydrolase superfamily lysophospholipase